MLEKKVDRYVRSLHKERHVPAPHPDMSALVDQLPKLVRAIEDGFETRRLVMLKAASKNRSVMRIQATKVYAALADDLGENPQSVRQDLLKYKSGTRMPGPAKLLAFVDCSTRLRYIKVDARGTGAERLVDWCRREIERQALAEIEEAKRIAGQKRARVLSKSERLVDELFEHARPDFTDAVAEELLFSVPARIAYQLVEQEPNLTAGSATMLRRMASTISKLLTDVAREVDAEFREQQSDAERVRERILAKQAVELERISIAAQSTRGMAALRRRALSLGIGGPQLERILKRLATGRGLGKADAAKRITLLEAFRAFRPQSEWTPSPVDTNLKTEKMRTWKDVKQKREQATSRKPAE